MFFTTHKTITMRTQFGESEIKTLNLTANILEELHHKMLDAECYIRLDDETYTDSDIYKALLLVQELANVDNDTDISY